MTPVRYQVVLEGRTLAGRDVAEVMDNLAQLFGRPSSELSRLLAGRPTVIRRALEHGAAIDYRAALEKAGAACRVEIESLDVELPPDDSLLSGTKSGPWHAQEPPGVNDPKVAGAKPEPARSQGVAGKGAFEVFGRFKLRRLDIKTEDALRIVRGSLVKYFNESDIAMTSDAVHLSGDLRDFWQRAITNAAAHVEIADGELRYRASGTVSLGKLPWLFLVLGFFTYGLFTIWFLVELASFMLSRGRPKEHFETALRALQFELG